MRAAGAAIPRLLCFCQARCSQGGTAGRSCLQTGRIVVRATFKADPSEVSKQRQRALERWDNEGGANAGRLPAQAGVEAAASSVPPLNNAELVQLHTRVIALENVVIALLAQATVAQLELVRDMAAYISPRPGFTPHPLTLGAADEMRSLVDRSNHFRAQGLDDQA
jgi:hypothetical protein